MTENGAPPRAGGTGPRRGRGSLRLGRTPPTLIHIVQDDIDENIGGVVEAGASDGERPKLVGHAVPAVELAEVNVTHLEGLHILEDVEGDSGVEWELFIATDESRAPVGSELEARDLSKGRVEILEIRLQGGLVPLGAGSSDAGPDTEAGPESRHARHDAPDAGDRSYGADIGSTSLGALGLAEERDVVGRGCAVVQVLQANIHGTDRHSELLETREQVEEVVGCEG
jgi:hypothetical protein